MLNLKEVLTGLVSANSGAPSSSDCTRPLRGPHAEYIPNVIMHTHRNQRAWFYDDLIAGKTVVIHCMAAHDAASCTGLETLAQVQARIGEQLGTSIFIYSITTDPVRDTPEVLRQVAEKYGAKDGWLFLTGDEQALSLVRERMFIHSGGQDCSMSLLRYGNEAVGLWGGTPIASGADLIMERLSWIMPRKRSSGPSQRGGPPELVG